MVFDLALDSNHCKNGKRHVAHSSKNVYCNPNVYWIQLICLFAYGIPSYHLLYDLFYVANVQF